MDRHMNGQMDRLADSCIYLKSFVLLGDKNVLSHKELKRLIYSFQANITRFVDITSNYSNSGSIKTYQVLRL